MASLKSEDDQARFASVVLPHLADAYALARWLTGDRADARRLEAAIAELPVPFRETLVLRDVQGLDYREISEVTKVPIGTVMSRLARARRRLIERIGTDKPGGAP